MLVKLKRKNNLIMDLNDWLDGKMELMELGFQLKKMPRVKLRQIKSSVLFYLALTKHC